MSELLPYHIVVGMPALSPTMESGTLAEWNVKEGDSFIAGDSLAKIDTDKASIDFEAQDDGHVAKLLIPANTEDVTVGTPIMVTVEEAEHVAAFANFVVPEQEKDTTAPPPPAAAAAGEPAVAKSAPVAPPSLPPVMVEPPTVVAAAAAAPPPSAAATTTPPLPPSVAVPPPHSAELLMGPAWGSLASVHSPLAKTLSVQQRRYIELYGTTGQIPM